MDHTHNGAVREFHMEKRKGLVVFKLISSIILCLMAGFIGSVFTRAAVPTWYATLNRPSFTPPSGVFGPVWTTLYLLMGISLFLIWRIDGPLQQRRRAIAVFILQLIPGCGFFHKIKGCALQLDVRMMFITEVEDTGELPVFHRQQDLDHTGNTGGRFKVPDM